MPKKPEPAILKVLEELYKKERKKIKPLYPVNKKTGKIELPEDVGEFPLILIYSQAKGAYFFQDPAMAACCYPANVLRFSRSIAIIQLSEEMSFG